MPGAADVASAGWGACRLRRHGLQTEQPRPSPDVSSLERVLYICFSSRDLPVVSLRRVTAIM